MTNNEIFKNLWDAMDIRKIDDDINEGIYITQKGDTTEINNYISKIQKKYELYINLYNSAQQLKRIGAGFNPNQPIPVDNSINHYIEFLQMLKMAKLLGKGYDEIFKEGNI